MADGGDDHGSASSSSASDATLVDKLNDKVCDISFSGMPEHVFKLMTKASDKTCLRCTEPVSHHKVKRERAPAVTNVVAPPAPAAAAGAAAPATVTVSGSSIAGRLQKTTEALSIQSSFILSFKPAEDDDKMVIDVARLLRAANAGHLGWTGIMEMVHGELPERPARKVMVAPWTRAEHFAYIMDLIKAGFSREVSHPECGDTIPRKNIFVGGTGTVDTDAATDLIHILDLFALGLRTIAKRDAAVFSKDYGSSKAKLLHPVLGTHNWFVVSRNKALDKVQAFMTSMVSAAALCLPPLPGEMPKPAASAAAGAAAGAAVATERWVDPPLIFSRFPWCAIGNAILQRGGRDDSSTTDAAWEALISHEAMVGAAVKQITGEKIRTSSQQKGLSADSDADADMSDSESTAHRAGAKRRRVARKKGKKGAAARKAAAAADAAAAASAAAAAKKAADGASPGGGAKAKALARARMDLIGKSVDDIDKDDCRKASLCFKCKKPLHGRTDCTARGKDL